MKGLASFVVIAIFFTFDASAIGWPDFMYDFTEATDLEGGQNTGLTAFPTLSIPLGGEMEGMSSAYTAVARDYSFLEANPAASSRLDNTELAVSHRNLIADANMESVVYTTRFEHLGLGTAMKFLHVPFTEYDRYGVQENTIRYSETIAGLNVSYNMLHSFDFHGIAIGANLKSGYRRIPEVIAPGQSAAGIMADVGMLTRFNLGKFYRSQEKNFSIGAAARNVGPPVLDDPLPSHATGGAAYKPIKPVTLAFDYTYPFVLGSDLPAEAPSYAGGASVRVTEFLAAQTGFQLRGGNPRFALGSTVDFPAVTLQLNYTLDLTTQVDRVDRFSVQASFNLGDRGRGERKAKVEEFYVDALEAYADGNLERAVELGNQALEIDPTFTPAAKTLENAEKMLDLQRQMESIRLGQEEEYFDEDTLDDLGNTGETDTDGEDEGGAATDGAAD
ncbi:MAG: UPF0164 family protein [Spirochaetota bacterium]